MKTSMVIAAVCATAFVVLSGCSSVPGTATATAEPESTSATPTTRPPRPPADYLLQAGDVPAGFTPLDAPADPLGGVTDSVLMAKGDGTFSPAECRPSPSDVVAEFAGKVAALPYANVSSGDLIVSTVLTDKGYIDRYRKYNLGPCSQLEMVGAIGDSTTVITASTTEVDIDVPEIDGEMVVREDVVKTLDGVALPEQPMLLAAFPIDDVVVLVSKKNVLGINPPDVDAFRATVSAAARRAIGD